jgi:hypothetical protein
MRRLAFVLATLVALAASSPARAGAPAAVTYRPPVDAPVVDPFRPSDPSWEPGNRGLEYATTPATPVAAAAAGEVVFAGPVADGLHVVVLHADGLRTSYSYLQLVAVKRGDRVAQGQTVGTTQARFHFGVRAGDAYLDPALLFGGGPVEVHLVPDQLRQPQTEAEERAGLSKLLGDWKHRFVDAGSAAWEWAKDAGTEKLLDLYDEARGAAHYLEQHRPRAHLQRFASAAKAWWDSRDSCTPASEAQPKLQERHILVRVAGLGSTSGKGAVDDVDAGALGYAPADDYRFSYLGGTAGENPYEATDTTADLRESGQRLRELLARIEAENPGVPIDIVAHSQGGLVARSALTDEGEPRPNVNSLVTLGSPHQGAPAATAATMVGHNRVGGLLLEGAHAALPDTFDPAGTSVAQMAEHSEFLRRLNSRPLPEGVHVTSVGARGDYVVPAGVTWLPGAGNVTVSPPGYLDDHGDLPGSAEAEREIALAVSGMAPTCQDFADAMADAAVSGLIYYAETEAGRRAWSGARVADYWLSKTATKPVKDKIPIPWRKK